MIEEKINEGKKCEDCEFFWEDWNVDDNGDVIIGGDCMKSVKRITIITAESHICEKFEKRRRESKE